MSTHFKNTELAVRYNISEATVRNWIKSSKEGKLKLELYRQENRTYVANSISNIALMESLVEQNRKYRNSLSSKAITPGSKFSGIFNEAQRYDIVRNLELHHDIPRQYGYFRETAQEWDDYINKQMAAEAASLVRREVELLAANYDYLDRRLAKFKKINVIDIGAGNAVPVKGFLERLMAQGKLGRYVAIDFSPDMLNIAERNLKGWFGAGFRFEGYQLDISHERFANLIAENYLRPNEESVNLMLFLGGTPMNLRIRDDAFRTICESMNPHDLLVYTDRLERADGAEDPPEWFRHNYDSMPKKLELLGRHRYVLDLIGIKSTFYNAKVGFDKLKRKKYAEIELKFAVAIKFEFGNGERTIRFEKGDKITVWHYWRLTHRGLLELLEANGFYMSHLSQSEDHYALAVAEPRRD